MPNEKITNDDSYEWFQPHNTLCGRSVKRLLVAGGVLLILAIIGGGTGASLGFIQFLPQMLFGMVRGRPFLTIILSILLVFLLYRDVRINYLDNYHLHFYQDKLELKNLWRQHTILFNEIHSVQYRYSPSDSDSRDESRWEIRTNNGAAYTIYEANYKTLDQKRIGLRLGEHLRNEG